MLLARWAETSTSAPPPSVTRQHSSRWNGQQIRTVTWQYLAFQGGRIQELAYDWFAQADDGSVWYLGEDVSDYKDGVAYTHEGTWLAGKDGPGALIMPAEPKVGDAYRTENTPGIVFEEITVRQTGRTVPGPSVWPATFSLPM